MMTMKKIALIAGMGLMSLAAVHAQQDSTLNRTVVVENLYNPTVMDASKINVLPKVEEPTVPKTNIDYATSLRPVSAWNYQAMQPIVREWTPDAAYRGYLRAGYGNNGNVDAGFGYLWDITKKDRLNVAASLDGWNGDLTDWNNEDWKSRLYNTRFGVDYRHAFKKVDMTLGGAYRSQVFNYMFEGWRQHQTFANAYIAFASSDKDMPIQFEAQAGIRYYADKHPKVDLYDEQEKEKNVFVKGNVWKSLNEKSSLGLGLNFDNYSHSPSWADDVMAIEFNPYYSMQNDSWKIRVGAHLDWVARDVAFSEDDENKLYVSPDVNVDYLFSDSYVFYAKAGGGRGISSFYELMDVAPYLNERKIKPTYIALDAAVGLKASPADGWWFNVGGGYQIRNNDVCLYAWTHSHPGVRNWEGDTKVLYATAELKYDYKDLLDFSMKGTYYRWEWESNSSGDFINLASSETVEALVLKPQMEILAEVGFKPIEKMRANVGYEYVKRCEGVYDPVSNLYLGADYAVMKNLKVFGKINNLLNKEYVASYAYPAQGLNFLAGVSLQF